VNIGYTSNRRLLREIFQACDPVKLLFGMFVLWVNWYSFNVGSTNQVSGGGAETAGRAAVVTTLGTAAGAMVSMLISDVTHGFIEPEALTTGILGALVSITAPCAVVTESEGALIGALGAVLAIYTNLWEIRMQVDDPCSAFAIHGACGIWGVVSVGLFAQPEPCMNSALRMADGSVLKGVFRGGGFSLLGVQSLAALTITLWAMGTCLVTLSAFQMLSRTAAFRWMLLRPTKAAEELGFDQTEHNIRRQDGPEPKAQTVEAPKLKQDSKWRKIQGMDAKSLKNLNLKGLKTGKPAVGAAGAAGAAAGGEAAAATGAGAGKGVNGSGIGGSRSSQADTGAGAGVGAGAANQAHANELQSLEFRPMSSDEIQALAPPGESAGGKSTNTFVTKLAPTIEETSEPDGARTGLEVESALVAAALPDEPGASGDGGQTPRTAAAAAAVLARLERVMHMSAAGAEGSSAGDGEVHEVTGTNSFAVEDISAALSG